MCARLKVGRMAETRAVVEKCIAMAMATRSSKCFVS